MVIRNILQFLNDRQQFGQTALAKPGIEPAGHRLVLSLREGCICR